MSKIIRYVCILLFSVSVMAFHGPCTVPNICPTLNQIPFNYELAAIGDSIFQIHTGACQNVASHLSIRLNERVPSEAVSGARITEKWETGDPEHKDRPVAIESQYIKIRDAARAKGINLHTVFLDGGANDVILEGNNACLKKDSTDAACSAHLNSLVNDMSNLMNTMKGDGVQRIVYSGYYNFKYTYKDFNNAISDLNIAMQQLCSAKNGEDGLEVIFVDQQGAYEGDDCEKNPDCPQDSGLCCPAGESCYDHYLSDDKLHPSNYGSDKLADNIYNAVQ